MMGVLLLIIDKTKDNKIVGEIPLNITLYNTANLLRLYNDVEYVVVLDNLYNDKKCIGYYGPNKELEKLNKYLVEKGFAESDGETLALEPIFVIDLIPQYVV